LRDYDIINDEEVICQMTYGDKRRPGQSERHCAQNVVRQGSKATLKSAKKERRKIDRTLQEDADRRWLDKLLRR
jgi:hypothetical protein